MLSPGGITLHIATHVVFILHTDNLEDDDNDDDDDEEEEEEEEDGDNDDSEHGGSYSNIIRTSSFGELEVEFVKMTDKIKNALIKKNIDVGSLIEQLSAMSTVRDKKVPLFDENVFETVKTVEDLWRRLRNYWSIRDYDILIFVLKIVECEEANDIYKEFLSRIDSSILKDIEFVLSCKEYKGEGLKEHLEVKLGVESLTVKIKKQAEEAISKVYNLEKYALTFKSIKEGCIELTYGISKALKSYLLQFQVTEDDFIYFSACNIVHLQICDKRLKIPSQVIDKVSINLFVFLHSSYTNIILPYVFWEKFAVKLHFALRNVSLLNLLFSSSCILPSLYSVQNNF